MARMRGGAACAPGEEAKGMGEEGHPEASGHGSSKRRASRGLSEFPALRSKAKGIPKGNTPLVAERSSRRGGSERSERRKGESEAFSLREGAGEMSGPSSPCPEPARGIAVTGPESPEQSITGTERLISAAFFTTLHICGKKTETIWPDEIDCPSFS
jgi:hypothetical protein